MMNNKIGRNDPCLCASGLKYKKCCLISKQIESENTRLQQRQNELKQKVKTHTEQEVVFLDSNSHPIKMSAVILEFADDMLRHADTRSEKKKAITLACFAWNLAMFKEKNGEYQTQLASLLKQMGIKDQLDKDHMEQLIDALVDKKINEYSTINRFIADYQIDFSRDELMLNVASIIPSSEVDDLAAEHEN